MILDDLIQTVKDSDVDESVKSLVITALKEAYDLGFIVGVRHTGEVQSKVYELLSK